jgi:uncharacterized protein (DUF362 family)
MSKVVVVKGNDPATMVPRGLRSLGVEVHRRKVVIKPNLIADLPYPVTTPTDTVEALVKFFKDDNQLIVAEGSGFDDTHTIYRNQGYVELVNYHGVELVDLNSAEFEVLKKAEAAVLKRFEFPLVLKGAYLISAAVLKQHSAARVTLSLKNMLGATIGRGKGRFHKMGLEESIVDINRYKLPDLAVIDGRLSLSSELGGERKRFDVVIFSKDPVAADVVGATTLGLDPSTVEHIKLAQKAKLGVCDLKKIKVVRLD